jgi:hypothetical protein
MALRADDSNSFYVGDGPLAVAATDGVRAVAWDGPGLGELWAQTVFVPTDARRGARVIPRAMYTLVETCAGSAALTLHLLGARRPLLPYQGTKWRFRHSLAEHARALGFEGPPERVVLTDPGPWGRTLGVVLDTAQREALIEALEANAVRDPREVYDETHGAPVPTDAVAFAAEFLFLQRLSFSGKAVGTRDGRWCSPGFNPSSAYGLPGTERFGEVKPMLPSLIRVLRSYDLAPAAVSVRPEPAAPPDAPCRATLVYLDPPYVDSTAYPDGQMTRDEVVALASAWREAGAAVMVSEQQGLDLPGWERAQLYAGRDDTSPFRGKQPEWVTFAGPRPAR